MTSDSGVLSLTISVINFEDKHFGKAIHGNGEKTLLIQRRDENGKIDNAKMSSSLNGLSLIFHLTYLQYLDSNFSQK